MRRCRHGIEWKSTKVWNTNCAQCREAAAAYERDTNRIHHGSKTMQDDRESQAIRRRYRAAGLEQAKWQKEWTRRRALGIQNRAAIVKERLAHPPELPPDVAAVLERAGDVFTPFQREAITYTYGYRLTQREAARVLNISRDAYRKRLELADAKLKPLRQAMSRRGEWVWQDFKTPYGQGYLYKDTGDPYEEPVDAEIGPHERAP